jgi:YcxB-like protein
MTSGPTTYAAELIQSRNANASEALTIMRAQGAAFRRQLAAVRGYRFARVAWIVIVIGWFAAIFFASKMHWIPRVSVWVFVPAIFIVAYGLCRVWSRYHSRVCAEILRECLRGDRRICLEADGIVISGSGIVSSVPWSAIWDIVASKEWLVIHLSPLDFISLPKAAFEGQNVESFCAELMHRWHEHRGGAGATA